MQTILPSKNEKQSVSDAKEEKYLDIPTLGELARLLPKGSKFGQPYLVPPEHLDEWKRGVYFVESDPFAGRPEYNTIVGNEQPR